MPNTIQPPPTRILSFQQMVTEADPNWSKDRLKSVAYEMSNGRQFFFNNQTYTTTST
jgi:hypothetical protein